MIIGPGGPERHDYLRHHVFRPYDERPIYDYGYGYGRDDRPTAQG